jgi:hypothetical protein
MFDLRLIRERLVEILGEMNGGELNVYAWPDPQPEFPCVVFNWPTTIDYHVSQARLLNRLQITLSVHVAAAVLEEAAYRLDEYAAPSGARSIVETLEKADGQDAWSNLTVDTALNWRQNGDLDSLAFDLEISVHA